MKHVWRLDYPKADIKMFVSTEIEKRFRLNACQKEPWTVAWIESMPKGSVLYDVGANVGSYTLLAAALGHTVVAIEPAFANYARLCENVLLNDLGHNVIPLCLGVGVRVGDCPALKQEPQPGFSGGSKLLRAPLLRMEDLPNLLGVPRPTHVKIDTDGSEVDVIDSAGPAESWMVEVAHENEARVAALLFGYPLKQRWDVREPGTGPPLKRCFYALYERA